MASVMAFIRAAGAAATRGPGKAQPDDRYQQCESDLQIGGVGSRPQEREGHDAPGEPRQERQRQDDALERCGGFGLIARDHALSDGDTVRSG